jgi:hypothetical protein
MVLLHGCSTAQVNDYQRQGFWDKERAFGTSSLTASRRMVIFKLNPKNQLRVCAEPPPTVGEELSKALSQALSANVDSNNKTVGVTESFANSLKTGLKQLEKAKAIQFEQDLLFFICQMYMNEAMDKHQANDMILDVAQRAERLLMAEIVNEKEKAPDTEIITASHCITEIKPLKLKVSKGTFSDAYSTLAVVVRKVERPPRKDQVWSDVKGGELVVYEGGVITVTWPSNAGFNSGDVLEAAIAVEARPKAQKVYYPATGHFVFYGKDLDKAKVDFSNEDCPSTLNLTLPKNVSVAFPNFPSVPPPIILEGLLDKKIIATFKEVVKEVVDYKLVDKLVYSLGLTKEQINKIATDRKKNNLKVVMNFDPIFDEMPEIHGVELSKIK